MLTNAAFTGEGRAGLNRRVRINAPLNEASTTQQPADIAHQSTICMRSRGEYCVFCQLAGDRNDGAPIRSKQQRQPQQARSGGPELL